MIINNENLFLIVLGLIWIIGAIVQDLRRREVDNLWNFSLIGFALFYRLAVSVFSGNYWFFFNGVLGFLIFLFLGNLFYYSRLFAGGDTKLIIALGSILPLSYSWIINLKIFFLFIVLFLISGSIYVLIWAFVLVFRNWEKFEKEFILSFKKYRKMFFISFILVLIWFVLVFFISEFRFVLLGLVILLFPILFVFSKAVEESCMVRVMSPKELSEGEWLYRDIVVAGKKIRASWDGISKSELRWIRRHSKRKVLVKVGVPFTPSFLFAFVLLLVFGFYGYF